MTSKRDNRVPFTFLISKLQKLVQIHASRNGYN